ncbi:MAG: winged helix-turn-helix transcriptional regulator, partial [Puniceicoccales bacterium]|nr:winged helix-turn-helix transcriptional regulator [Puniceicoccales bacterium]
KLASGAEMPYYIKDKGRSESGCFIRIGSSSQPMPESMIDKLMARRHQSTLANVLSRHQDLEFKQLKLYYGLKNKPLNDNFAKTLDFLTSDGQYNMIAFLFADNNNISIRLGKYMGMDKMDLIEREDYKDCCLITAMQKILDRFDVENITQSRKRPMQTRLDKNLADKNVLHEAIINAFAHNDYSRLDTPIFQIYSDRFEIISFGGLVDGLDLEKFYEGISMPRNREIMRIFKDLEYVEQLGSGIPKIVEKYGREGISVNDYVVRTTLKFDKGVDEKDISQEHPQEHPQKHPKKHPQKTYQKIVEAMRIKPDVTMQELAELAAISSETVKDQIKRLKSKGIIRHIGPKKGGHWEILEQKEAAE